MGKKHIPFLRSGETLSKIKGIKEILSNPFVHVLIIIALGFVIYINTFSAPLVFDDEANIKNSLALRNISYFTDRALQDKALLLNREIMDEHFRSRIIVHLTFALNYKLHGLQVPGYHVFNVLVHLANAVLVYLLVLLTTRTPYFKQALGNHELQATNYEPRTFMALFAGLLFVSHPVQTEAVTYITQRSTVLAAMFCLSSLVLYIKARFEAEFKARFFSTSTLTFYLFSIFSAVLAMKTKQISFTLPIIIALYEVMFFEGKARKRLLYLLPLLLTMLIVPLTVFADRAVLTDLQKLEAAVRGEHGENEAFSYLLTQFRVIVTYLRLLVLPVNQNLDYDYPIYHSFLNPNVFLSFLFLLLIIAFGIYLLYAKRYTPYASRFLAFGIFWFFITLSVESSIIPLADIIFEHRLYLPSVGMFIAVTTSVFTLEEKPGGVFRRVSGKTVLVFSLLIIALSIASYRRNTVWQNETTLWHDVVSKSPYKARGYNNLGVAYDKKGEANRALEYFSTAISTDPYYFEAYVNRGIFYEKIGLQDRAIEDLNSALSIDSGNYKLYNARGVAYGVKGEYDRAIGDFTRSLSINPYFREAYNNRGVAYDKMGNNEKAIDDYNMAISINPDYADTHYNLGIIYEKQGDTNKAINEYKVALRINPDYANAHNNLGCAYTTIGLFSEAAHEFQEALRINPKDANARKNLEILSEGKTRR